MADSEPTLDQWNEDMCDPTLSLDFIAPLDLNLDYTSQTSPLNQDICFSSLEEALEYAKEWARTDGFELIKLRSKRRNGKGPIYKVWIACDHHGIAMSRSRGIRKTKSRKCGCSLRLFLHHPSIDPDDPWIIHSLTGFHNHRPDKRMGSHPTARLIQPESRILIETASRAGIKPIQIKQMLEHRGEKVLLRDIYNHRVIMNLTTRHNRSPIQMILQRVESENWIFKFASDPSEDDTPRRLTHLFLIHPLSFQRLKQFPDILLIDATYKVNKYQMPLVHICGITSSGQTFSIAFCFMKSEKTVDYNWLMLELRAVYDQIKETPLLMVTDNDQALINAISRSDTFGSVTRVQCLWHLEQNVKVQLSAHMKLFRGQSTEDGRQTRENRKLFLSCFWDIVKAKTEADFHGRISKLEEIFYPICPAMVSYFWNSLYPNRQFWAVYHTHQRLVFGVTVTSRVESAHARLKQYVQRGNSGLYTVVDRITNMIVSTDNEVEAKIEYLRSNHSFEQRRERLFDSTLLSSVSHEALNLVLKQIQYARNSEEYNSVCSTLFQRSMGLPCSHTIMRLSRVNSEWKLSTYNFHSHWLYDRDPTVDTHWTRYGSIAEPQTVGRRTKRAKHASSSTKRDATLAEIREAEDRLTELAIHRASPSLFSSSAPSTARVQTQPETSFDMHGNLFHSFQM